MAELGDVTRFADEGRVCSWAGLTPRHRESDTTVPRGSLTKRGKVGAWAAVEAVQRSAKGSPMRASYDRIVERRGGTGKNVAKVAAARKLLSLVYYGLRDGEIRCPPSMRHEIVPDPIRARPPGGLTTSVVVEI